MHSFRHVVRISASDGAHSVETELEINVLDENDSAPQFDKANPALLRHMDIVM